MSRRTFRRFCIRLLRISQKIDRWTPLFEVEGRVLYYGRKKFWLQSFSEPCFAFGEKSKALGSDFDWTYESIVTKGGKIPNHQIGNLCSKYISIKCIEKEANLLNQEAVIHGDLPQRIVFGFTGNINFNGAYHENTFRFHHFNMNSISLYRDGNQVGSKNLKSSFIRNEFVRSFFTLLRDTGIYFTNAINDISQNEFKGGSALFCFDFSADRKSDENFELVKTVTSGLKSRSLNL